jgi:hypothetical protein
VDKTPDVANTCFNPSVAADQHIAFSFDDAHRENDDSHRNQKEEEQRSEDPVPNRHIQDYVPLALVVPIENVPSTKDAGTDAERCGNDGPWKAWKTKSRFSILPTVLGNREAISTFPHLRRLLHT